MKTKPLLLVVEDSPEDLEALARALKKANIELPLVRCEDGDDALDYFYRRGKYSEEGAAPRPALVLLDLNLPGTDGREVLTELKGDKALCHIPIIIFTTSNDVQDINTCYAAGANGFVQKPVGMNELVVALEHLVSFWLHTAILPGQEV